MAQDARTIRAHAAKRRFHRKVVRILMLFVVVLATTWTINALDNRRPDQARTFVFQQPPEDFQLRALQLGH